MRIFSLKTKDYFTGIASGAHIERGGIWHKAEGINPFINPEQENTDVGLLQTSPTPVEITGGVGGTPLSAVTRVTGAGAGTTFIGTTAGVSEIDMSGDNNATTTLAQANMTNGLELFQSKGSAEEYLYYWQDTQIGRYGDLNGTPSATDAWATTGVQSTNYHPTHKMWDEIYYGNKDRIGQIKDDGAAGQTHSANVLDFESNMLVTALEDDGQFLVIGLSTNQGDNTIYGHSLVRFWKINSSSWSYEWSIPEPNIIAIKKVGLSLYAICPHGVYIFNRNTPPRKVRSVADSSPFGMSNAVGTIGDAVLWGRGATGTLAMYGNLLPDVPTAYHEPYSGAGTGSPTLILSDARYERIIVGTDEPKLYRYNITAGGATGVAETVYIALRERYDLNRIEVIFGEPLASGDSLNIDVQTDEDNAATDWGTYSFAKHGAKKRVDLYKQKTGVDNLKIFLNFTAGNVKIKQINIYGDKLTT